MLASWRHFVCGHVLPPCRDTDVYEGRELCMHPTVDSHVPQAVETGKRTVWFQAALLMAWAHECGINGHICSESRRVTCSWLVCTLRLPAKCFWAFVPAPPASVRLFFGLHDVSGFTLSVVVVASMRPEQMSPPSTTPRARLVVTLRPPPAGFQKLSTLGLLVGGISVVLADGQVCRSCHTFFFAEACCGISRAGYCVCV